MQTYYYRVQLSNRDWILRHPEQPLAIIKHPDKEELLKQLPHYFKSIKQPVLVKILDDFGRIMEERTYP